jgi:hypothetical protein
MTPYVDIRKNEPIPADRRSDPRVRKEMSGPAMRTFFNIADGWRLTTAEQLGPLGWPGELTLFKYKAGKA